MLILTSVHACSTILLLCEHLLDLQTEDTYLQTMRPIGVWQVSTLL